MKKEKVVTVLLHNASLAALIVSYRDADSKELSESLAALLSKVSGEEQREDILSALAAMNDQSAPRAVFSFLEKPANQHGDLDYETALLAVKLRMKPELFTRFIDEALIKEKDTGNRALLEGFKKRRYRYGMVSPTGMLKIWEGIAVSLYDDGLLVTGPGWKNFQALSDPERGSCS